MGVGDFSAAVVRFAFFEREQEACFRCRRPLRFEDRGIAWSAHHRRPRGNGGTSDPRVGSISNCLILCGSGTTGCHGWVETYRAMARDYGYLIPLNMSLDFVAPAGVRVKREDGTWWLLPASGWAVEVEDEGAWR